MPMSAARLVALAAFAAPALAQNVIVVDAAGGPGSDFTTLVAAVAAASDGDILLLRSGSYVNPGLPLAITKSLVVQEDRAQEAIVRAPLVVDSLGSAQSLTWRGVAVLPDAAPSGPDLLVKSCAGAVRFTDATFVPAQALKIGGVRVESSSDVAFVRCVMLPSPGVVFANSGGIVACDWQHSRGALHDCDVRSVTPLPFASPTFGFDGGVGVRLADSQLFASGSWIEGTNGGAGGVDLFPPCYPGGDGGDAVQGSGAAMSLQTLDDVLKFGLGGAAVPPCTPGADGVPIDLPPGAFVAHAGTARELWTTSPVREGQSLKIQATGAGGEFVLLFVATAAGYADLPGIVGPALVSAPQVALALGSIPGSGAPFTLTKHVTFLTLGAGVEGLLVRFQAAFAQPATGTVYLSNESDTVLLDMAL